MMVLPDVNGRVISILVAAVVLAALLGGWSLTRRAAAPAETPATVVGPAGYAQPPASPDQELSPAPAFAFPRLQGDGSLGPEVRLEDFRGQKAVLVNSWATWCPPCKQELLDFASIADEFADDIVIVAINRGESRAAQADYLRSVGGRNLFDTRVILLDDPADSSYAALGGFGMPVTAFVTKGNHVAQVKSGLLTREEMRTRIRQTLAAE